ncbi:putative L-cystine transporter protein [Thermochaetoides thermophila DSM 1495]|uniref:Putative L-cystine transporter protein n=1 Tax=Chaetomium thermophilum (strain DSM 1495 / CBS 144.50 / IMI 039719) TaxID=759272 RepID=G0SDU3_CHATD|nr:putative L-cystine transporter protein [Thermochaetoides thermophila DSM 1495]EGS18694.1 putative L-cystine transporter protein [Thermochaetoides thermophila DSM 1495]
MGFLELLSGFFGLAYFTAWSISFYPQGILNYRRKSTSGTVVDFHLINILGFTAYFASNVAFYYSSVIRAQYAARYKGLTPTASFSDITFAFHGILASVVTTSQYLFPRLWGFTPSLGNRPSRAILGVIYCSLLFIAVVVTIVMASPNHGSTDDLAVTSWVWLDVIYAVSYVKLVVTLIKYTPQVLFNYRNRSTKGWSILMILLDFSGGILSIAQQGIDSYIQRDWSGITGNPVKFALGNVSIIYDLIFIVQHYVLYRDSNAKQNEYDPLLASDEERR